MLFVCRSQLECIGTMLACPHVRTCAIYFRNTAFSLFKLENIVKFALLNRIFARDQPREEMLYTGCEHNIKTKLHRSQHQRTKKRDRADEKA